MRDSENKCSGSASGRNALDASSVILPWGRAGRPVAGGWQAVSTGLSLLREFLRVCCQFMSAAVLTQSTRRMGRLQPS